MTSSLSVCAILASTPTANKQQQTSQLRPQTQFGPDWPADPNQCLSSVCSSAFGLWSLDSMRVRPDVTDSVRRVPGGGFTGR